MKRILVLMLALLLCSTFGCKRVKTYTTQTERVDQELSSGNRGYLAGQAPAIDESTRKTTRDNFTVEVDLPPYSDAKKAKKRAPSAAVETEPIIVEPQETTAELQNKAQIEPPAKEEPEFSEYTVQISDTLQKIAKKFYGSMKDWYKIYEANKDKLSSPDKIKPGQVLKIPKL